MEFYKIPDKCKGEVIKRFECTTDPIDMEKDIEELLAGVSA